MASVEVSVDLDAFAADLARGLRAAEKAAERVMGQAGDMIAARAKELAPERTSELKNSIDHTPPRGSFAASTLTVDVVAKAEHASHVEFGTRPHVIRPRFRKALRFPGGNGFRFAKSVNHPGTKAQPYLSKAAEELERDIASELEAAIALAFMGDE